MRYQQLVSKTAEAKRQESVRLAGNDPSATYALAHLSDLPLLEGDVTASRAAAHRALEFARMLGNRDQEAAAVALLAHVTLLEPDYQLASGLTLENLRIERELQYTIYYSTTGLQLAAALIARVGASELAVQLLGSAAAISERTGNAIGPLWQRLHDETLANLHTKLTSASFDAGWEEGSRLSEEDAFVLAAERLAAYSNARDFT